MPLTGELEHLPIVDVIQLIHSTRKSGMLSVYSRKGEGKLLFNSGYIVGATHSDENLRIGQILVDAKIISDAELQQALAVQQAAGEARKPLLATLINECGLSEESGYKALETLIELTIVEMISWSKGFFSLEIDKTDCFDAYRYLPNRLQELTLDTQMVLMDALRIFDEKVHAGEIQIVDEPLDEMPEPLQKQLADDDEAAPEIEISEDILGLADLDKIEKKKPHIFKSLEAFDPSQLHRQAISSTRPELSEAESSQLAAYLATVRRDDQHDQPVPDGSEPPQALILLSNDALLQHALTTVCKSDRQLVFSVSSSTALSEQLAQMQQRNLAPILILDAPGTSDASLSNETLQQAWAERNRQFPEIPLLQLVQTNDCSCAYQALQQGARTVIPRPLLTEQREQFAERTIQLLETIQHCLQRISTNAQRQHFPALHNALNRLGGCRTPQEISQAILQYVASFFDRSLTLVVSQNGLIAERSIGIEIGDAAVTENMLVPIEEDSTFQQALKNGEIFYGSAKAGKLHEMIGAPLTDKQLIAPLRSSNKTFTLTYADFGNGAAKEIPLEILSIFFKQASLLLENALLRRQLAKSNHQQNR